jgi:methylated-DNA-[protein]-cysteine S-methyltransferase
MNIQKLKALPKNSTFDVIDSPVGKLAIITSVNGLHGILWDKDCIAEKLSFLTQKNNEKTIMQTKKQLTEYFQGKRQHFDLPLVLSGTDFQLKVWQELAKIPYAKTISYGEQANGLGDKKKARAVGVANGKNPIPIIIPCHRVIGSTGRLVGFGGGIDKKDFLLSLERQFR